MRGRCPGLGERRVLADMSEHDREKRPFRRRRRENAPGGRSHSHRVRVSAEEEAQLVLRAERLGVTVPRLLVESALQGGAASVEVQHREREDRTQLNVELNQLQRKVGAIGVNINQIARATNATGEWQPELQQSLVYLRGVLRQLEDFRDRWSVQP